MRRIGPVVACLAALGVVAGCAGGPEQVGFGGLPEPPSPRPTSPPAFPEPWNVAPEGATPVPPEQVDAGALPEGYPRLVWTEQGGYIVGAHGQEGGCGRVHAEVREQSDRQVRITLVEVITSAGPCTMDLRFPPVSAVLEAPLGERTVVLDQTVVGPPPR